MLSLRRTCQYFKKVCDLDRVAKSQVFNTLPKDWEKVDKTTLYFAFLILFKVLKKKEGIKLLKEKAGIEWKSGSPSVALRLAQYFGIAPLLLMENQSGVRRMTSSPDGRLFALEHTDGMIYLWNQILPKPQRFIGSLRLSQVSNCLVFSPDGQILASGFNNSMIGLWWLKKPGEPEGISITSGHKDRISCLAFSSDGRVLASGSDDGTIGLWGLKKPGESENINILSGHETGVNCLAFSPDGQVLASGLNDGTIGLWGLKKPGESENINILSGHEAGVNCLAFSPNGKILASGSGDSTIRLWALKKKSWGVISILRKHKGAVIYMNWRPPWGLISCSKDGTVKVWGLSRMRMINSSL